MNRGDELSQSLEQETIRCKELEREVSDLKLLLHKSQSGKS